MSLKKKIVWLPYDMDTAIGINNEGGLMFSYNLEDTDHLSGGANIFNGQDSVLWNNVRLAFFDELKAMYQRLRSQGVLSYDKIEKMFEEHQSKWPEAIFNEDAYFKYIMPLIESGTATYLDMLQGSKAEQRKWWLYNRFRYIDSKYNAGDALSDFITLRGYAAADITVIPYADIYPAVKYGSYLVSARGQRNTATTLVNPLETLNDTEIAIYSSSQLASVGDLSPLKVGLADFSMATKLQAIKIGDADSSYQNTNLASLSLGNNVLLKALDVRNCVGLGDTSLEGHTQTAVDISGCEIIEEVYFDGTKIKGLTLPNGGVLKALHLPGTITNLTIRNQPELTDLTVPDYSHVSTLWLENAGAASVIADEILAEIASGSRVRLIGFNWSLASEDELSVLADKLDTLRGIDESGGNVNRAQMQGSIYVPKIYADDMSVLSNYPYIDLSYDEMGSYVYDLIVNREIQPSLLTNYNEGGPEFSMANNAFSGIKTIGNVCLYNCYDLPASCFSNSSITELKIITPNRTDPCYMNNSSLSYCTSLIRFTINCVRCIFYSAFFRNCTRLAIIDVSGSLQIYHPTVFSGASAIKALIIRSNDTMSSLSGGATAFDPIITDAENLTFHIYVPASMLTQFETSTNWSTVNSKYPGIYRAIEDYTLDGTITGEIDENLI